MIENLKPNGNEIKSKVFDHQWVKKSFLRLINHLMNTWKTVRVVLNGERQRLLVAESILLKSAHNIIMVIATRFKRNR